ncbi:MAG: hypothetical protein IK004_00285 [Bacteroidales bacterium]|nr:hypothetical protein [Bacteroidales bacterium]
MKRITKIKAMFLALMMLPGIIVPVTATAQRNDGFFKNINDNYENRTDGIYYINDNGNISNYGIGEQVPLGSGLLILTAIGAGYAISKRRRNFKHGATLLLVFAMLLGMTNCKKNVETINTAATEGVFITLDVDGGSKVIVNPTGHTNPDYATVTFENGDIIYVGNNGKYCGYLEHNGTNFSGTITPESEADYLHFYFMGNKGAKSEPSSVSITDQTSEYPVISYARSKTLYNSEVSTYSAKLQNYCAIVRFTTTNINVPITIEGMNNTVTVDFGANNAATSTTGEPYSFSKTGDGQITLHAESNTDRWAILLPQGAVTTAMAYAEGYISSSTISVPEINANTYHGGTGGSGISVTMTELSFSVGASTKVFFAPGNLQATTSNLGTNWTWSFASNQWDFIGRNTANTSISGNRTVSANGTVDLFGWIGNSSTKYDYYGIAYSNAVQYYYGETLKNEWGEAANGLGGHTDWRTPTKDEWYYLFKTRTNASQKYGHGIVNSVHGLIILPDNWTLPTGLTFTSGSTSWSNSYTVPEWRKMEKNGAVFLPAAGVRSTNTVSYYDGDPDKNPYGYYWSSTNYNTNYAYFMRFGQSSLTSDSHDGSNHYKSFGHSVRLVRTVN